MKFRMPLAALLLVTGCLPLMAQTGPSHSSLKAATSPSANVAALPAARPVARINGSVLTDRDLLREMLAIFPYARQHNNGFPKEMEADIRRGALKMIEFEELVYQEALRRHMTVAPERLAKADMQFRKQFTTEQQFQEFLKFEAKGSRQILKARIRRSLLIEDLLKMEVTDKSAVTVAEAKAFYDKYPARFKLPESFALQTITVFPPKNPAADQLKQVRARAEGALRQAKATRSYEEFGLLAEKISEDDYRVVMGDHKAVATAQLPPPVLQAALRLQPGQMSDLIQVEQAFTIIRLNAHNPERMQKFAEVKDTLRQELQRKKIDKLRSELDARLRKTAKVEEL